MIFFCLKTLVTPCCWQKSFSPFPRLAEHILMWHLSIILWPFHRNPAFQPHQPIWSFLSTCYFKLLCSSSLCQEYHSPSLSQIIKKNPFSINVMKSLMMKTELKFWRTHIHTPSPQHDTQTSQSWEARQILHQLILNLSLDFLVR